MQPPKRSIYYRGHRARSLSFWPLVWLIWACTSAAVVAAAAFYFVLPVQTTSREVYAGTIKPARNLVNVFLPAGAKLKRFEVEPGQAVRAGQTVATLDVSAMEERLLVVEENLHVLGYHLNCLQSFSKRPSDIDTPDVLDARLAVIETRCRNLHSAGEIDLATTTANMEFLETERELVEEYLRTLFATDDPEDAAEMQRALALILARNRLDQRITAMKQDLVRIRNENEAQRMNSVRLAVSQARAYAAERTRLSLLIAAPRLTIPRSATITRVRDVALSQFSVEPVPILEATPQSGTTYFTRFSAPMKHLERLSVGTKVSIRAHGLAKNKLALGGQIFAVTEGRDDTFFFEVKLDAESVQRLQNGTNGIALHGKSTASVVTVNQLPRPVVDQLTKTLFALLGNFEVFAVSG
ncbi:MAG: hypothetical protein AAF393_14115 [Pseudomonadota bacterium]